MKVEHYKQLQDIDIVVWSYNEKKGIDKHCDDQKEQSLIEEDTVDSGWFQTVRQGILSRKLIQKTRG